MQWLQLLLQFRIVLRINVLREKVFARANVILEVMPGTIEKVIPEDGAFERIAPMWAQTFEGKELSPPVGNHQRLALDAVKTSAAARNVVHPAYAT